MDENHQWEQTFCDGPKPDEKVIDQRPFVERIRSAKDGLVKFCQEYPVQATALGVAVLGFVSEIYKTTIRLVEYNEAKNTIYDRSAGHRWKLKRRPSSDELLTISRKVRDEGKNLGDVLEDMRLLKK